MPEVAGDLRTQSFAELWRAAPLFRRLREGELGGKCGRCEYRRLCGGCRARALALEGDVLAADPSCAYQPTGGTAPLERAGDIAYGDDFTPALVWADAARARMDRIPSFVRGVVMRRGGGYPRRQGPPGRKGGRPAGVRRAPPIRFSQK